MSNRLYEQATHVVSMALFPAFLVVAGALVWQLHPLPKVPPPQPGSIAARAFDDTLSIPDLRTVDEPISTPPPAPVASAAFSKPARVPKSAPSAEPQKTRHCEEYALYESATAHVLICEWR